jgi:hypothetical protein
MTAQNGEPVVPDIVLERLRLGELPNEEAGTLAQAIARDPALAGRVDALERSDEEIRRAYPPEWLAAQIRRRLDAGGPTRTASSSGRVWYWTWTAAAAAAIALVVVALPRTADRPIDTAPARGADAGEDRIKGLRPTLAMYRRTADGSETLADGAVARPGDLLRVGYRAAGRRYGVILSLDGRGSVTLHLPPDGQQAVPLERDTTVLLDRSYELDDAPRWERFYFITANAPFTVAPIVAAARQAAASHHEAPAPALALPQTLEQSTFSLQKEARP